MRCHLKCHLIIFSGDYYYYYSTTLYSTETNPLTPFLPNGFLPNSELMLPTVEAVYGDRHGDGTGGDYIDNLSPSFCF